MGKPLKIADRPVEEPGKSADQPEDDVEMSFLEHLGELRNRLVRAMWGILPGIALSWAFKERILDFLTRPLVHAWIHRGFGEPQLHFANPIDPFVAYVQLAVICGLIFGSPWALYQLWLFVAPGLYRSERRYAIPFTLASAVFFIGGAFFGYAAILAPAFDTLLSFAGMLPDSMLRVQPTIMLAEYLDFSTRLLLAFGITFEIPVVITFLAIAGVVDWRQLLRFFRWWVVISAVISAVLTPGGDIGMQMMMLVPLVVLYLLSVLLAWLFGPKRASTAVPAAEPAAPDDDEV
jgi:sec-independent protein translocase protein TatC